MLILLGKGVRLAYELGRKKEFFLVSGGLVDRYRQKNMNLFKSTQLLLVAVGMAFSSSAMAVENGFRPVNPAGEGLMKSTMAEALSSGAWLSIACYVPKVVTLDKAAYKADFEARAKRFLDESLVLASNNELRGEPLSSFNPYAGYTNPVCPSAPASAGMGGATP